MADAEQPLTGNPAHRVPRLVLPELTEDQKKNLDCLKIIWFINLGLANIDEVIKFFTAQFNGHCSSIPVEKVVYGAVVVTQLGSIALLLYLLHCSKRESNRFLSFPTCVIWSVAISSFFNFVGGALFFTTEFLNEDRKTYKKTIEILSWVGSVVSAIGTFIYPTVIQSLMGVKRDSLFQIRPRLVPEGWGHGANMSPRS